MRLFLHRSVDDGSCTLGQLYLNSNFFCYTLELPIGKGAPGEAIPDGTYDLSIHYSAHFQRMMPFLLNVPNRSGIMIHPGNWASNTKGCILVGEIESKDAIYQSEKAFDALFPQLIEELEKQNPCTISIFNPAPEFQL